MYGQLLRLWHKKMTGIELLDSSKSMFGVAVFNFQRMMGC